MKKKILKDRDVVFFELLDKDCGRAEFSFCPVWKRGKLRELYIYPEQQPKAKSYFVVNSKYCDSLQVRSWTHKGFENPNAWFYHWCKEHKTTSFRVYPPDGVNCFKVEIVSTLQIIFEKKELQDNTKQEVKE